jgi:hypothetical protein
MVKKLKKVNKTISKYARIAGGSYHKNRDKRKELLHEKHLEILDNYSDDYHNVIRDNKTGEIILGIRGTQLKDTKKESISDLGTDALLALLGERGLKMTPRYKKSKNKLDELKKDFPDNKITLTAHSLGGGIGYTLGNEYDLDTYNFNSGSLKWTDRWMKSGALSKENRKKHKFFHTDAFDPLSFTSKAYPATHHTVPVKQDLQDPGVLKAHSIENFY